MNPVNAAALYVSASRAVLQCDPRQPHTFSDMYTLLPFFRQSLACLVCGKLLQDPISQTHPECQHYVCLGCKGQKMQIRPSCSRCKDYSGFQENKQLSLLVQLYRKLCLYVTHSPLLQSISSHAGGNPEVMALLEEALPSQDQEMEDAGLDEPDHSAVESLTPTEAPPVPAELSAAPQSSSSDPPFSNGPQECNGELLESLDPSSPELEVCELIEEQPPVGLSVSDTATLELSLTTGPFAPTPGTVCSLRDGDLGGRELEEGEVLLLSVEEVLQTLDPLQPGPDAPLVLPQRTHTHTHISTDRTQMYLQLEPAHNYTQVQTDRTHSHGAPVYSSASFAPPVASKPPPVRLKRKRSRSESDREKVKPLPIASILQGSSLPIQTHHTTHAPHAHHPPATPSLIAPAHTYSSLPLNGAPPKTSRPAQNHSKGPRKHGDMGGKKPHTKARSSGGAKNKERSKDQRLQLSSCLVPPAQVRAPYKKPVEKKGCKCGRATQNPSVLTCRGQRCPCYSNRKACLDCICRGCQNSYMANGEKKLEAFAVPEKALEQTRLTLGINLTSITAAAALRSPAGSSIRANTLLNVATATGTPVTTAFLSPSPPQEPSYEDSLELLIG
uniref:E3 ubiquitin-protein ligase MSL2-like n=1 Tax=Doryrhamphus excisus TaxID=161450 RepID=UPI0025AE5836|nr:E3 ubiquitin-protein ligase MSL2-like [Doryrhamphus excisus]